MFANRVVGEHSFASPNFAPSSYATVICEEVIAVERQNEKKYSAISCRAQDDEDDDDIRVCTRPTRLAGFLLY